MSNHELEEKLAEVCQTNEVGSSEETTEGTKEQQETSETSESNETSKGAEGSEVIYENPEVDALTSEGSKSKIGKEIQLAQGDLSTVPRHSNNFRGIMSLAEKMHPEKPDETYPEKAERQFSMAAMRILLLESSLHDFGVDKPHEGCTVRSFKDRNDDIYGNLTEEEWIDFVERMVSKINEPVENEHPRAAADREMDAAIVRVLLADRREKMTRNAIITRVVQSSNCKSAEQPTISEIEDVN